MAIRLTGKVIRLYIRQDMTYIMLDAPVENSPKDRLFTLDPANPNYNAQYSLALAAAANRWPLSIRVVGHDITPELESVVNYLVVDWAAGSD